MPGRIVLLEEGQGEESEAADLTHVWQAIDVSRVIVLLPGGQGGEFFGTGGPSAGMQLRVDGNVTFDLSDNMIGIGTVAASEPLLPVIQAVHPQLGDRLEQPVAQLAPVLPVLDQGQGLETWFVGVKGALVVEHAVAGFAHLSDKED